MTERKQLVLGILAHVDAGKTTLSESILYETGKIKERGRVDKGSAYLDTDTMEKERGITIFSKMATFPLFDIETYLLDTPGHVDFSAEMEKTLSVLDDAVLVISGADGVQGHTETLWKLLTRYHVPTFLFVNKMDQPGTDRTKLLTDLRKHFGDGIIDFSDVTFSKTDPTIYTMPDTLKESMALQDERLMEKYLETGDLPLRDIRNLIWDRKVFPVFFGSALKNEGVDRLLRGLYNFIALPLYPDSFGARVFKITRDQQGKKLSFLKITGGVLRVRDELLPGEKVPELRVYSGQGYENRDEVAAGGIAVIPGMAGLETGMALGAEPKGQDPTLTPVLDYQIQCQNADTLTLYTSLRTLREEFPELHLRFDEKLKEIHVALMGAVQTEVLTRLVKERFSYDITFSEGKILYKETIAAPVEGVGHFEPLRHYAEVHLLMEPLTRGSGLQFRADCPTDMLARNWQRLILTHLQEREHVGVLTGSPITDIRFTLVAGRASIKHTEGGDFREATYRAVRQGLRKAENILLEPMYHFTLEIPQTFTGRAMTDLSNMHAAFSTPEYSGQTSLTAVSDSMGISATPKPAVAPDSKSASNQSETTGNVSKYATSTALDNSEDMGTARIEGTAPVSAMRNYAADVSIYTKGRGHLMLTPGGYDICRDAERVVEESGYDPDADIMNPCASVFCAHGTGFLVPPDQVESYMHVESPLSLGGQVEKKDLEEEAKRLEKLAKEKNDTSPKKSGRYIADQELEDIFIRTYGPVKNRAKLMNEASARTIAAKKKEENTKAAREAHAGKNTEKKDYLLVDGYNIIFSWDELKPLAATNLDSARSKLLDILSNYAGYTDRETIVVFDAHRVAGHIVEQFRYNNLYVVFTKEAQTADEYIEELAHTLRHDYHVTVATSDRVVQVITWGAGATILSAKNLEEEVKRVEATIRSEHLNSPDAKVGTTITLPN